MLNNEPNEPKSFDHGIIPSKNEDTKSSSSNESYPLIAGVLLILSSALAILNGIVFIFSDLSIFISSNDLSGIPPELVETILFVCGIVILVLAIFALLGGIMSIRKKMWGFALGGAILGLFTLGPLLISSILSIIALIFIVLSRDQFEKIANN